MTAVPQAYRLPLPAGSPTSICECSHDWCMHGQSGWTSRSAVCHGWTGNATPGPYEPCRCAGFKPWNGPRDSRTGEPVGPLTVAVDARIPDAATLALLDSAAHRIAELEALAAEMLAVCEQAGRRIPGRWRVTLAGTP